MMMKPRYYQSVAIHRGTYGEDGRMEFSGTPDDTVSGGIFEVELKSLVVEGEIFTVTAQGFLELAADVQRRDHLVADGKRYEVMSVVSGHDHRGRTTHVGVNLRETEAY